MWALLQACMMAMPGTARYFCDCESVVTAIKNGQIKATAGSKEHARAYHLLFARLDDIEDEAVTWVPAHCKDREVGKKRKGDGSKLSAQDVQGNAEADRLAKKAVGEHRVEDT